MVPIGYSRCDMVLYIVRDIINDQMSSVHVLCQVKILWNVVFDYAEIVL